MSRSLFARLGACPSLLALILTAAPASAQNYYWNQPAGGLGDWNTTSTMWSITDDVAPNLTWLNDGTATAIFDSGSGNVTLTEAISAAGLSFTSDAYTINRTGTNALTLMNAGTIDVGSSLSAVIGAPIAGSVGLTKTGAGTLTLSGTNTYTGVTNINAGTVVITATAGLGDTDSGTVVAGGASLTIGNNALNITGETLTLNGTGVANEGALRKIGTQGSSWAGAITLGSASRINSDTTGLFTISGAIGGGTNALTIGGTGNTTITSVITTSGTLTKDGAGTLTLSGGNGTTLTGAITVTGGGVISVGNQLSLGSTGMVTLDNGTIRQTNAGPNGTFVSATRNITLGAGGGTLEYATAGQQIIVQTGTVISGTSGGALNKTGPGIIAVVTPATYDGPTNVLAGTLRVRTNSNVFPVGTALTVASGATFDLANLNQQVGSLTGAGSVTVAGGTLTVGDSTSTTFSGVISGTAGKLTKVGTGTLTLSGVNTYTGATAANGGTLAAGAVNTLPAASAVSVGASGTLDLAGFNQTIASLAGAGNVTLGSATLITGTTTDTTHSGVISGTGSLTKQGTGTQTLSGANTYTGGTTISAGTLQIGNNGSNGSIAGDVTNNATLQFNRSNIYTFGGVISGSGAVTQAGSSRVDLTGANTYTGVTRVNNGVLAFNSIANVGAGSSSLGAPTDVANGTISIGSTTVAATLRYTGSTDVSTNRVINMAGTTGATFLESAGTGAITYTSNLTATGSGAKNLNLIGSNTGANTIAGVIPDSASGATSLVKNGAGTWVLTGANTYTGPTTVVAGVLQFNSPGAIGGTGASMTVNASGTAAAGYAIDQAFIGRVTSGSAGTVALAVNSSNNLDFSAAGANLTAARLGGVGTVTYSGTLTPNGDTYRLGGGGGTLTMANPLGDVGGPTNLNVGGGPPGTVVLNAANTYTGTTTVGAGTLAAGAVNALPAASAVTVASGAVLNLAGFNQTVASLAGAGNVALGNGTLTAGGNNTSTTYAGVMSGTGGLTKQGTGTMLLSGANTYTGTTAVSGGTLGGTGQVAGPVTVASGTRVLAGNGTAAGQTFTIGNNLTVGDTGGIRVVAGNGVAPSDVTTAGSSLVAVGGVFDQAASTGNLINIDIALDGSAFQQGTSYTRRVLTYGTLGSNLAAGDGTYTNGEGVFAVNAIGFEMGSGWQVLVGQGGNFVDVQFTPVPEPGTVLAIGAAGLGLGGLVRRRLRRRDVILSA